MRITIIGLPGSGKTHLAERIAEKMHIPHIQIDRFWLESGGGQNSRSTPNLEQVRAHVESEVLKAIQQESWVSDGFYSRIQSEIAGQADTVLFLDLPLRQRLSNHAKRIIWRKNRHKEVTFWGDVIFFFEMVRRERTKTSKINDFLKSYQEKTVVLKSFGEIEQYLKGIQ